MKKFYLFVFIILSTICAYSQGVIVPTDTSQRDFLKAYKFAWNESYLDYRFTGNIYDMQLFPAYSESSPYWVTNGTNKGAFIIPQSVRGEYVTITSAPYGTYKWQDADHYSIQYKPYTRRIAVFNSSILINKNSVTWTSLYFKNLFDTYLGGNNHYFIDENYLDSNDIDYNCQLLIIPAFRYEGTNQRFYIDSVFARQPKLKARLDKFLANGGTIYAEGNSAYFIEKLGYLSPRAVDFDLLSEPDKTTGLHKVDFRNSSHPVALTEVATGGYLFGHPVPKVNSGSAEVIAEKAGFSAVAFILKGGQANGGRIIVNTGIPVVEGINSLTTGGRQLQWSLNAIFSAFATRADITRSVFNQLPDSITAGKNAIPYDRLDTFDVRIKIRNLSSEPMTGLKLYENLQRANINGAWLNYFKFAGVVTSGIDWTQTADYQIALKNISVAPHNELEIVYKLATPDPEDKIHEYVNNFLSWSTFAYASVNTTEVNDGLGFFRFNKYRNYVDMMFSAFLAADTDLNWKNILGLYYQPFKVFMIMENKERTNAEQTVYTQYIPKDVPFYWTDRGINIPILKTPGGKFVDVLKGSNDQTKPDYDLDSDGQPDAWLDTASIYPKGYTIVEDEVYWLNPWEHLRTGNAFYYEDIDHDGKRAEDTNGDGIVDIEEPGDKIRVWKVTWNIGRVKGYDYYDPYCSYEIWIDPPDLVKMAAGVGYVQKKCDPVEGMYYPYSKDINNPDLNNKSWTHWMETDSLGNIDYKQLIFQKINNYEGYTFIDTAKTGYKLKPTDVCAGTTPTPHNEYIAVLSLGGEEIDMRKITPKQSLYSKLEYKTIFNEKRVTPIRSTYTYWAPLPNPMQFEYLSNNYIIKDLTTGDTLRYLPERGKVSLEFDLDASTEYSYYWIRNAGHDVDYNDPSELIEGNEKLGDGVFGYMVYDIPKGMGGYKIHLPKNADGTINFNELVSVDGKPFTKWLDNPNTGNKLEVWEDQFQYHIYVPQLLIPPAIDDNNKDGIDDWIDDRGDRFCSKTGFLHDGFMLDDGEQWLEFPKEPFVDDIYGLVEKGWYGGADNEYGDDFFENLGKTHFKFKVIYEGLGKEGPVDLSKGGWLVVEEIFGGSPWVIFSHTLNGYAQGIDYSLTTTPDPAVCKFGLDTVFIKHVIEDKNEPHSFDSKFDPYYVSYGYGETTITTYVGGKDPCSLISPAIDMPTILDPGVDKYNITLVPYADKTNPELKDFPKQESGSFIEVKIEVMNGTDDNWLNTTLKPILPEYLGASEVVMSYVAYPRPLVPAKVDPATGEIIQGGDDIGSFKAGWRFNQPEGEVLVKMGNTLPLMQPSRRAYFIYVIKVDPQLANGIYNIDFDLSTERRNYLSTTGKTYKYEVPQALFSITDKNAQGNVVEYQKLVIGSGSLKDLTVAVTDNFIPHSQVKFSSVDFSGINFDTSGAHMKVQYDQASKVEKIDLSAFQMFPTVTMNKIYILQRGSAYSYNAGVSVPLTKEQSLNYEYQPELKSKIYNFAYNKIDSVKSAAVSVKTSGPKIILYKQLYSINGQLVEKGNDPIWNSLEKKDIGILVEVYNAGNDMNSGTLLEINAGDYFTPLTENQPDFCEVEGNIIKADLGYMVPGEMKKMVVHFTESEKACQYLYDNPDVIPQIEISYKGHILGKEANFRYPDLEKLIFPAKDFALISVEAKDAFDISYGSLTTLTAKIKNGMKELKDLNINLYAVVNHTDTSFVGMQEVDEFNPEEVKEIDFKYSVPENVKFLEFFVKADPDNNICEFCENNNTNSVILSIQGPRWIQEADAYPNPFKNKLQINYRLPRQAQKIKAEVFDVNGRKVATLENLPVNYGENNFFWEAPNLAKGVYTINLTGTNDKGETEKYYLKAIKE